MITRLERLTSEADLARFSEGQAAAYRDRPLANLHPIPVEDLRASDVVMALVEAGPDRRLLGGYVINHAPRRTLAALTPEVRERLARSVDLGDACEIVCVWKRRDLSRRAFAWRVWAKTVPQLLALGRRHIFGMAYRAHGLDTLYRVFAPTIVQDGAADNDLRVFYYSRLAYVATASFGIAALTGSSLLGARTPGSRARRSP